MPPTREKVWVWEAWVVVVVDGAGAVVVVLPVLGGEVVAVVSGTVVEVEVEVEVGVDVEGVVVPGPVVVGVEAVVVLPDPPAGVPVAPAVGRVCEAGPAGTAEPDKPPGAVAVPSGPEPGEVVAGVDVAVSGTGVSSASADALRVNSRAGGGSITSVRTTPTPAHETATAARLPVSQISVSSSFFMGPLNPAGPSRGFKSTLKAP
ncbi:MAG TPA: hypothetical protein ENI86_13485 [Acidimicrobiales bacterium]|nr:hypothetical protein [Acidimicrobiales bacterium]